MSNDIGEELDHASVYLPTPDEIRAACLEIQETWTPREEIIRRAPAFRPVLLDAEGHNYAGDAYYSEGSYCEMFGDK